MRLENLEKEKIDSLEETQMDSKTLNMKKNKEKKKKEKAANEVTEDGNKKSFESEEEEEEEEKREREESLEESADAAHKKKDKGGKMESLSSEANGNGDKKRKGAVANGDDGTVTKKKKRETEESLEKSANVAHKMKDKGGKVESLSSEANGNSDKKRKGAVADGDDGTDKKKKKRKGAVADGDDGTDTKKKKKKKKRETEESLEKSADAAHKKKDRGGKMESLSSEANGNGDKMRKGAVADGDDGTDMKKKRKRAVADGDDGTDTKKKKKREGEESLEKSADAAHKKKDKSSKMESLSPEANGNGDKMRKGAVADGDDGTDMKKKKRKKKKNRHKDGETTDSVKPSSAKAKKATTNDKGAEKGKEAKKSKKSKKVSFAGEIEVLGDKLVRGKRFSEEEDQLIRDAVYKYIDRNQLGEKGLEMVLKCSKHSKQVKGCWKEIGAAIPGRPYLSVYYRAHTIFERSEKRGFSEEEMEIIKKFHAEYGPDWKKLSEVLGKQRIHVKDAWRRIRLPNRKSGRWSQDEYQSLFDLVNLNLRMKAFEEKKPDNPIVKGKSDSTKRENIFWEAISDKLSTRTMSCCCHKWYDQLTSPLVREGVWANTDDYLLLDALQKQDGCNVEDVDWDSLVDGRSGEVCQRRWGEMLRHLGGYRERTFIEQLDVLTKRYCGEMLQYRFRQQEGKDEDEAGEEKDE